MNEEFTDISDLVAADDEKNTMQVYEVGYHVIPTLSEAEVAQTVASIAGALKKAGVDVVGQREPVLVDLAYAIEKKIEGTLRSFPTAYFGWVAFEVAPQAVTTIDEALKGEEHVLRHLIIKTSRDTVAAVLADPSLDVGSPEVEEEVVSEGELDEALENLEEKSEV